MKKNENLKRMTKSQRNEMAVEAATKTEDHIYYDYEYPLVINKDLKIEEIFRLKEDEEEYNENYNYYNEDDEESIQPSFENNNVIRIVFKNKEKSQKKQQQFIMDINSELTLEEFEQKLLKCKDESDIEDLQEDC